MRCIEEHLKATDAVSNEKHDIKNIELIKQIQILRDHLDVHRILGINAEKFSSNQFSSALGGYLQISALNALAIHFCKIYEPSGRHDLNSIPGIIDSLPESEPSSEQCVLLTTFGARYSNVDLPTEVKSYLAATFGLFSDLHCEVIARLKRHRNKIGAHSEFHAPKNRLPSHSEFEALYQFAFDFYSVVAEAVLGVGPAIVARKTGKGLLRVLESTGVPEPAFDFPFGPSEDEQSAVVRPVNVEGVARD